MLRVAEQSDCLVSVSYPSAMLKVDFVLCILQQIFKWTDLPEHFPKNGGGDY